MSRPKGAKDAEYETRRSRLLHDMSRYMMTRGSAWPSLRELAAAAGVSVPTIRHYFGGRTEVVDAVFAECLRLGQAGLDAQAAPNAGFEQSIRAYVGSLLKALETRRDVNLGDLFAVGLGEGLLDPAIARSTLRHIIDPTLITLERRLQAHMDRGEMRSCDVRSAALMLATPLLLTYLHQRQLHGDAERPASIPDVANHITDAFVRAFAA